MVRYYSYRWRCAVYTCGVSVVAQRRKPSLVQPSRCKARLDREFLLDRWNAKLRRLRNGEVGRNACSNAGAGSEWKPQSPMLVIVGMILLLTWTFDYALHLAPSSLVNLLLLFATISFVLDFLRERENLRHPRPGWDAMPPKGWFAKSVRRARHKNGERTTVTPSMKLKATRAA